MGGSDDPENLVELTVEEHALAHKRLYEQHGKHDDYVAWKALEGTCVSQDLIRERASLGGRKQGAINRDTGHMAKVQRTLSPQQLKEYARRGVAKQRQEKSGSFYDPVLHSAVCAKGGKAQGRVNAENGHCKDISRSYWDKVKSGEIQPAKRMIVNDGTREFQIKVGEPIPDGCAKGRLKRQSSRDQN
jgi:hypothetical protein